MKHVSAAILRAELPECWREKFCSLVLQISTIVWRRIYDRPNLAEMEGRDALLTMAQVIIVIMSIVSSDSSQQTWPECAFWHLLISRVVRTQRHPSDYSQRKQTSPTFASALSSPLLTPPPLLRPSPFSPTISRGSSTPSRTKLQIVTPFFCRKTGTNPYSWPYPTHEVGFWP